ncbi:MAG TPA: nuclease-related domain-containing protein [Verrucomicrobiales bacterium]|nr:nuclease-related domain-containing protein [Verrucomicrobiales bacterium]
MPSPPPANTPTRRLLNEVIHPRYSLFDDTTTRERQAELTGRIAEYAIIVLVVLIIAGLEIARWFFNTPPKPELFSFMAACLTVYSAIRVGFIWRQIAVLRREQRARQSLHAAIEEICGRGWLLFDGLTDTRGHLLGSVLAGPGGLFTLIPRFIARGKNLSEIVSRRDANTVTIGSHQVLADPIGQARRAAHALYELLADEGMDTVAVQPVVVFPGWVIGPPPEDADVDVWVISEADIVPRFTEAPTVMEAKDLIAVSLLLERMATRPVAV